MDDSVKIELAKGKIFETIKVWTFHLATWWMLISQFDSGAIAMVNFCRNMELIGVITIREVTDRATSISTGKETGSTPYLDLASTTAPGTNGNLVI